MVPATRWLVVGAIALGVLAPTFVPRLVPARGSDVTAAELARKVEQSTATGWSGEVRTQGSLDVPLDSSSFGGVARLLGEQHDLRVWWRDSRTWRVDRLRASGETDIARDGDLTARWDYEEGRARFSAYSPIRLPDDNDVVPPALAARLLDGASADELSRLPARRVAGADAAGVRLVPADPSSTIARVDVWVDEASGLPLRVEVYGDDDTALPVLTSQMTRFEMGTPSADKITYQFSPGVRVTDAQTLDRVAAANAFAPFLLPSQLIDLARRGERGDLGAVGVYGRGPTALLAIPLRDTTARDLHRQLARSRTARESKYDVALEVGPLSVLLVQGLPAYPDPKLRDGGNFLLTGTITPAALRQAAVELQHRVVRTLR